MTERPKPTPRLSCRGARRALARTTERRARAGLDAHLATCADCQVYARVIDRTSRALASAGPAPVPDGLGRRIVRAALATERPATSQRQAFIDRWIPIAWPAALLCSVATAALLLAALPSGDRRDRPESETRVELIGEPNADPVALLLPFESDFSSAGDFFVSDDDPLSTLLPPEER